MGACFDGLESRYCEVPPANSGNGEVSYQHSRKVINVARKRPEQLEVEFEDQEERKGVEVADMVLAAEVAEFNNQENSDAGAEEEVCGVRCMERNAS
jgi:hypothetical protein